MFISTITICIARFLSTLSLRRATGGGHINKARDKYFYPRSPCGERPSRAESIAAKISNFYPRSPCGERPSKLAKTSRTEIISIHALLAESDSLTAPQQLLFSVFLSTLSLRRATYYCCSCTAHSQHFYPRSPCGERPAIDVFLAVWAVISIHALLAESDPGTVLRNGGTLKFLSTLSLRRATSPPSVTPAASRNFYPRSPCGERPELDVLANTPPFISIHALLAESDARRASRQQPAGISIHALLAESDHGRSIR